MLNPPGTALPRVLAETALYVFFPYAAIRLARSNKVAAAVGPVTVCYVFGIAMANLPGYRPAREPAEFTAWATIALAIPLLLFSLDIGRWLRLAGTAIKAFLAAVAAVTVACVAAAMAFGESLRYSPELAGMYAGVYTGGTPNMAAVSVSLGVPSEVFVSANASDLFLSAIYVLFLFTVGPSLLGRFLPPYPSKKEGGDKDEPSDAIGGRDIVKTASAIGLAVLISGAGAVVYTFLPVDNKVAPAILVITTLAVAASLSPRVRGLPGSYDAGQYLLLVFCTATGAMADLGLLFSTSLDVFAFDAVVISATIVLTYVLGRLLRVDRDTMMITSTACIMSPAFVGPVAGALDNREIVITGLAGGLMGYAVGNYLGIGIAWMLG